MIIAIASGKGGTGKTTVATNLAYTALLSGKNIHLLDCDVEEPNCHIFLKPEIEQNTKVSLPVPKVDEDKCNGCGECAVICQYSAIISLGTKALTFSELCHGCGGCKMVCPEGAITWIDREIGVLESGKSESLAFSQGCLRIGEAMCVPLIRRLKASIKKSEFNIIDAPPGTSCPMIMAVKDSDYVCLVTEPTPFGLNDLGLAVETVRALKIPMGVIINRSDIGDDRVLKYCQTEKIPVLAEIPDNRRVAEVYSEGELVCRIVPGLRDVFEDLLSKIENQVGL